MKDAAQGGFSLIELGVVAGVLGVGLGGLATLLAATLRQEGEAFRRMTARELALGVLEEGAPPPHGEFFRATVGAGRGRREARVLWPAPGGFREVRLARWDGHD